MILYLDLRTASIALSSSISTLAYCMLRPKHVSPMPSFLWGSKMFLKHQVCTLVYGYFEIYVEFSLFTWKDIENTGL